MLNVLKAKIGLAGATRGSPSLVNGVRLRTSSLRGSRVRIPPPAPACHVHCFSCLGTSLEWGGSCYPENGLGLLSTSSASLDETSRLQISQKSPFFLFVSCELHGLWTRMVSTAIITVNFQIPVKRLTSDSYRIRRLLARPVAERERLAQGASGGAAPLAWTRRFVLAA